MGFNEHVKIREEKFGTVIFETLKEKVYVTNEVGKDILALLQKGNTPEEIVTMLEESYDDQTGQLKSDVMDFITQLNEKELLQ